MWGKRALFGVIFLILASSVCAPIFLSDHAYEGEGKAYALGDKAYYLSVVIIEPKSSAVIFELNGERTKTLGERNEYRFSDGSIIIVKSILGGEGNDLVEYYFSGSGKAMLPITGNIAAAEKNSYADEADKCSDSCNDGNACTDDYCIKHWCMHNTIGDCPYGRKCYNISQRTDDVYCGKEGIKKLKENGAECGFNYECRSKMCDSVCISGEIKEGNKTSMPEKVSTAKEKKGFFRRVLGWIAGLF